MAHRGGGSSPSCSRVEDRGTRPGPRPLRGSPSPSLSRRTRTPRAAPLLHLHHQRHHHQHHHHHHRTRCRGVDQQGEGGEEALAPVSASVVVDPNAPRLWQTEVEVKSLSLALAVLYVIRLGRLGSRRRGSAYELSGEFASASVSRRGARATSGHAGSALSTGKAVSAATKPAGQRDAAQFAAQRRARKAKAKREREKGELTFTKEEMEEILAKRLKELEKESALKRDQEEAGEGASEAGGEASPSAPEGSPTKFAFQDVQDQAKAREAAQRRKEVLEKERREREEAKLRREEEIREARDRLKEVKEDLDSARHASIPKSPLDMTGEIAMAGDDGLEVTVALPRIGQSFTFTAAEEETCVQFASRVAGELLGDQAPELYDSVLGQLGSEEVSALEFGVTFDVQRARLFQAVRSSASGDLGDFSLLVEPGYADFSDLGERYQKCSRHLVSGPRTKSSFLQMSLEFMLSLDSGVERMASQAGLSFKRLSFFPLFRQLFGVASAEGDREAVDFLKDAARDILRTVLSLETEGGRAEFQGLCSVFGPGQEDFAQVLARADKEMQLEAKRKKFTAMRKLASRSDGSSPIPEKTWALRNVAGTLALKRDSQSALTQAKAMYGESVRLKEEYLGSDSHPGLLEDLLPLSRMLSARGDGESREEALQQWGKVGAIVEEIVDVLDGDGRSEFCSEITMGVTMALGEALGRDSDLSLAWKDKSMAYFETLGDAEREQVFSRLSDHDVLQDLATVFSCDIESRQNASDKAGVGRAALEALRCYEL